MNELVEGVNKGTIPITQEISQLIDNGFICDVALNEQKVLDFLFKKSFFDSTTLSLILVPTMECNFMCPYCFELPHKHMRTDAAYFDKLVKFAQTSFKNYNHIEISLFGGEPLLNIDKFVSFLSVTKKLSIEYKFTYRASITTNGSLLTAGIIDSLISYNCGLLQITLDGNQASHDKTRRFKNGKPSFAMLIEKINGLLATYLPSGQFKFLLRINLNNNSVEEMEVALERINENLRRFIFIFFRPVFNTESYKSGNNNTIFDLRGYYELASRLGFSVMKNNHFYRSCEACGNENTIYVMPNLSLWKCITTLSCREPEIGHLLDSGEVKLDAKKIINWYLSADCFDDSKCLECKLLPDCYGGCVLYHSVHGKRLCSPFELVSLPYLYR